MEYQKISWPITARAARGKGAVVHSALQDWRPAEDSITDDFELGDNTFRIVGFACAAMEP